MARTCAGPIEVRAALAKKISDGFTIPKTYKSNKEKKRKKEEGSIDVRNKRATRKRKEESVHPSPKNPS